MKISSITNVPAGMLVQTYHDIIDEDEQFGSERLLAWAVVSDESGDRIEPVFLNGDQQPIVYSQHLEMIKSMHGDRLAEHSYQIVNDKGNLIQ